MSQNYGDNGIYTVTVTAFDDDGGISARTFTVTVDNAPPVVVRPDDVTLLENEAHTYMVDIGDRGSDDVTVTFDWGYGGFTDTVNVHLNNEALGADAFPSPEVSPVSLTSITDFTYGDDGVYTVTVTVEDDDGGVATTSFTVTVRNVAPTLVLSDDVTIDENGSPTWKRSLPTRAVTTCSSCGTSVMAVSRRSWTCS